MQKVYLDHSATTPVDKRVADKMYETMTEKFGNPSSVHSFGRTAKQLMDEARHIIAGMLKCEPSEIFFTSGGTEADNLALIGTVEPGEHLITTAYEHHAVLYAAEYLQKNGRILTIVNPDKYGIIHPEAIKEAITAQTKLVSVMNINNEVGSINPIDKIADVVKSRGILFHVDAVQSFGKINIDLSQIPVDLLSLSGHKIYAPKGIGALFIRKGTKITPRSYGGHHERGIRAGTENLPGIVGLAYAAQICQDLMPQDQKNLRSLRNRLQKGIQSRFPDVTLNGHPTERLYSICNLSFPGIEGETMLMSLDLAGIAVSTGSACSSGSTAPSHVLTAMGLTTEQAHSSIRFSLGRSNSAEDIDYTIEEVTKVVERVKNMIL